MKKKSVLDAYALLAYLKKEGGHARVLKLMESGDSDLFINSINVGEVFYIIARARGIQAADYFLTVILPSLPVTMLDNSLEDVIDAARLKAVHALSYADCFAAATAIREQVPLVTGDPEFKKLGQAVALDWIG
ncbi:MAG TPA: type II toxin-antitoxin system VapC family toxin [Candidatus Latescibacteria bacterium]|nr:type II toxin-antitoxin system VapC family toxin [Candidatus Latescibacterota bacterium]